MEKPKRCPLATWFNEKGEKKVLANDSCYIPFLSSEKCCVVHTAGMFTCPEVEDKIIAREDAYLPINDYTHCDIFSRWWWNKFGGNFSPKSNRRNRAPISRALRHEVFKKSNYTCAECGKTNKETILCVDHIIPVSQGGTDELDNLQCLCEECNQAKSNRIFDGVKNV